MCAVCAAGATITDAATTVAIATTTSAAATTNITAIVQACELKHYIAGKRFGAATLIGQVFHNHLPHLFPHALAATAT